MKGSWKKEARQKKRRFARGGKVPPLRPSNEHSISSLISPQPGLGSGVPPIARVQRGPSQAARCASREAPRSLAHHRRTMMMNHQPLIPDELEEIRG